MGVLQIDILPVRCPIPCPGTLICNPCFLVTTGAAAKPLRMTPLENQGSTSKCKHWLLFGNSNSSCHRVLCTNHYHSGNLLNKTKFIYKLTTSNILEEGGRQKCCERRIIEHPRIEWLRMSMALKNFK